MQNRLRVAWISAASMALLGAGTVAVFAAPRAASWQQEGQAAKPALAGKWDLTVTTSDGPQKAGLDLTVGDDGAITGSVESHYGNTSISSGSLSGSEFTIKFSLNIEGNPTDVSMSGSIDGDSIKGSGSAGDSTFDFTGSRITSSSSQE
jgi:hypothetical protein